MSKYFEDASDIFHKIGFELRKHSPEILVGLGISGSILSTVLACKSTLKLQNVIDSHNNDRHEIELKSEECSEEDKNKLVAKLYFNTAWKLIKLYGPSAVIGAAAIACTLGSHKILTDRNIATAAAYSILSEAVAKYRDRVKGSIGEEEEKKLWDNKQLMVLSEDAPEVKKDLEKYSKNKAKERSPYARIFDAAQEGWDDNPELTLYFLRCIETQANNLLQKRGHLFLNEVYDMLGFDRTTIGQYVGWLDRPSDPNRACHVDFGLYDINDEMKRRFINGYEQNVILDFNVDGVIVNDINDTKVERFKK